MRFIVVYLLIFVLLVAASSLFIDVLPHGRQGALSFDEGIWNERVLEQPLYPKSGKLHKIGMTIRNPYANKGNLEFFLQKNGEVLRQGVLSGWNIPDGGFVSLDFEPVDVDGGEIVLILSSPDTREPEPFRVYATSQEDSVFGKLKVGGEEKNAHISGVLYYGGRGLIGEMFGGVVQRFIADLGFSLFYLALIIGLVGWYFYLGKRK